MKAKQRETSSKKRIESPLAKYNSLGHLSCVVCNVPIKSEILWQTHILGKQHKEKVAELKSTNVNAGSHSVPAPSSQATKRKGPSVESQDIKKVRDSEEQSSASATTSALPAGFFEKADQPSGKQATVNVASLRLLAGDYDDEEEEDEKEVEINQQHYRLPCRNLQKSHCLHQQHMMASHQISLIVRHPWFPILGLF